MDAGVSAVALRRVFAPNGWSARLALCFAATAGILYAMIMPALVDAFQTGLGFSAENAGRVASANTYGGAVGALGMALFGRALPWRVTLLSLALALMLLDAGTLSIASPLPMMTVRFVHGVVGGAMVGISYLVISRVSQPNRTFGMLMALQYAAYMIGVPLLPQVVRHGGIAPLFLVLIAFSALTFGLVLLLPDYPEPPSGEHDPDRDVEQGRVAAQGLLALLAVLLFQSGNNAVNAYSVGLGQNAGLPLGIVLSALGAAGFAGLLGGVAVMLLPASWRLFWPTVLMAAMALFGVVALIGAENRLVWLAANVANGFAWGAELSLLLAMCASFEASGRSAIWSSFMSKLGLATGPLLGSFVIGSPPHYRGLIAIGAALLVLALLAALRPTWSADRHRASASDRLTRPHPRPPTPDLGWRRSRH